MDEPENRKFGDDGLSESGLYKELGNLTKDRDRWEENVPFVSSLLSHESGKQILRCGTSLYRTRHTDVRCHDGRNVT